MSVNIYTRYNSLVSRVDSSKDLFERLDHLIEETEEFIEATKSASNGPFDEPLGFKVRCSLSLDEACDIFNVLFSTVQAYYGVDSVQDFITMCTSKILKHDAYVSTTYALKDVRRF